MKITSIIRTELSRCFTRFNPPVFWSEANIFVAKRWPFRKHLIITACFIHCDIYENFMDGNHSSLWHFGSPLNMKVFYLTGRGLQMKTKTSLTPSLIGRDERAKTKSENKVTLFSSCKKRLWYDASRSRQLSGLVWKSFHRLLHSAGNWNGEMVNGRSNSSKDDAQWSVIRLGSCLMWMCEKTSVPVRWLQFGTAHQRCYTPAG